LDIKEMIMSKIASAAVVAVLLLTGTSAAMARPHRLPHADAAYGQTRDENFTDLSRPDGGYPPNSPRGEQSFWDYQQRNGK
jgi:hypothetical protein